MVFCFSLSLLLLALPFSFLSFSRLCFLFLVRVRVRVGVRVCFPLPAGARRTCVGGLWPRDSARRKQSGQAHSQARGQAKALQAARLLRRLPLCLCLLALSLSHESSALESSAFRAEGDRERRFLLRSAHRHTDALSLPATD